MTREEHMQWAKRRAIEYIDAGELSNALASMGSDLGKHPETRSDAAMQLGMMMLISGQLSTAPEMRKFIEGFR